MATDLGPYEVKVSVEIKFNWLEHSDRIEILATRKKLEDQFTEYAEHVRFQLCRQLKDVLAKRGDVMKADDEISLFHSEVLGNG